MPSEVSEDPPICDYEGSDYQTRFWDQGDRAYEDQTEAIALRRLLPTGGQLLLEIGAGAGRNTPRYHGYNRIVLLDYSRTQLEQAAQRLGESSRYLYVAADAYRLPFTGAQFDAVTMIRVLHHMADAPRALGEVRRVLHAGGTFILEFASKRHLKAIFRFLLGRQAWSPFSPEPVEFAPLNFDFHPAWVRAWLAEARLAVERQLTVSHFRLDVLKRTIPLSWLVAADSLAQWTGDWWQLTPSVFVRARAGGQDEARSGGAFFQCPGCGRPLAGVDPWEDPPPAGDHACPDCNFEWSYRDGIYSFK